MTGGWGRWGVDDEAGAANLIDGACVLNAASEIRSGRVISLAAPIRGGRGFGLVGRPAPVHLMMRDGGDYAAGLPERGGFGFTDDMLTVPTHGVSHVDALAHVFTDGRLYNDVPVSVVSSRGAAKLGIDKMPPIVTRGVFVDAATAGTRQPEDRITLTELQDLIGAAGVVLRPGDALLVRTGWLADAIAGRADGSAWGGLDSGCGEWLAAQDVVLVGADNPAVEAFPSGDPACQVPMHITLIRNHGIYLGELLNLDELAAAGRPTFMFTLAALPLVGGVGSPVVPLAIL